MNLKYKIYTLSVFLMALAGARAAEIKVGNVAELKAAIAKVKPGDRIIMANGEWKDADIAFTANGTAKDSVYLQAETPGKVALTGQSSLEMAGSYLVVKGLWFKEGYSPKKYVVSFSSDKKLTTHSRLTDCAITGYNPEERSAESHWIELWGKNNRVDHCTISGKTDNGTTLVVWLKGEENHSNHHRIDHNFFGERPPLGSNGGETIRIGTSTNSLFPSETVVEYNTFYKCDGEVEVVSNKSCNNVYRYNLFLESQGSLVMRHGNGCLAENNVFLGGGKGHTGGVRIINEGHTVKNNYFSGITGTDFRGPVAIMNGVLNGPKNRYNPVKNANVLDNIFYDCSPLQLCVGSDKERTVAPESTTLKGNIIHTEGKEIFTAYDDIKGITFTDNIADAPNAKQVKGFAFKKLDWVKEGKLYLPESRKGDYALFAPALDAKTGVSWEVIRKSESAVTPKTITVAPGKGTLEAAVKKAKGKTTLLLSPGSYELERPVVVQGDITIDGGSAAQPYVFFTASPEKQYNYVFKIEEGARLTVKNIHLSGKENSGAKYGFNSPSDDTSGSYSLYIDHCTISDFNNAEGGAVFKANKGTFADTLKVSNSILKDCTRGFNLSYEKDDKGKYNAENIIFENSAFSGFKQWVLNYYRGGNDESTLGGNLHVNHCVFTDTGSRDKDYVLITKGILTVKIENSVFYDNPQISYPFRLAGKGNSISNSVVYNSGEAKVTAKAAAENIAEKNPGYEKGDTFIPKEKSPLKGAATDGKDIGLIQQ